MTTLHLFSDHSELQTLRDWLRFAVSAFNEAKLSFGHGSLSAYDEAAYLILHTLHLPLDTLEPFLDARLTNHERKALSELLKLRVEKKVPAAYLTHEAWLGDLPFYVDERVIVPRSFIAEPLREALFPWIDSTEKVSRVLDMCTGSACLAILAAHIFPQARVDAVDISADALAVARRNVDDYQLNNRVQLIESNLFSQLDGQLYDLIISNPPYVDAASVAKLPAEYLHEPTLALGSGQDGLDATREILEHAAGHLTPGGILLVEIGHNRDALESAYPKLAFNWLNVAAGDEFIFILQREDLLCAGITDQASR